eukprot:3801048-Lingulodinium_polyedra.AAC.1
MQRRPCRVQHPASMKARRQTASEPVRVLPLPRCLSLLSFVNVNETEGTRSGTECTRCRQAL